jgi:hypothetical protein
LGEQSDEIRGHQSAESARISKGQSRTISRGEDERDCFRKENVWPAKKSVEMRTEKNKQKTPGNSDGGSTKENEETFINRVEVKDS